MQNRSASTPTKPPPVRSKPTITPSAPLKNISRERFCQLVVAGVRVKDAYHRVGYRGQDDKSRWIVRNAPEVVARINWMLEQRVLRDCETTFRPDKKIADAKLRLVRELERLAYADIREIVSWDRKAKLSPEGDVIEIADEIITQPSHKLSRGAAASIKSVTTKSGALKLETHDKLVALRELAKVLGVGSEFELAAADRKRQPDQFAGRRHRRCSQDCILARGC